MYSSNFIDRATLHDYLLRDERDDLQTCLEPAGNPESIGCLDRNQLKSKKR
jgi:hypothetical protein